MRVVRVTLRRTASSRFIDRTSLGCVIDLRIEQHNIMKTNTKRVENKVALVTGGTSGIGRATAIAFARAGAKVVVAGRREKEGAEVVGEIKTAGGEAIFVPTDVSKESDVKALVDQTTATYGRLDVAFNNA